MTVEARPLWQLGYSCREDIRSISFFNDLNIEKNRVVFPQVFLYGLLVEMHLEGNTGTKGKDEVKMRFIRRLILSI